MKHRYGSIEGLRVIACIGIVMMHIRANTNYEIDGFLYNTVIPSFTNFVFLFMMVSAFGMCCEYYEKVIHNTISFSEFYSKRFKKILPFFALLVLLDLLTSPSINSLYEGFADITLLFGFLPEAGNISVIGVGWFLGLIFVFYICFPFFCTLLENKRRAWIAFAISLIYNFVCSVYFGIGRTNILYSACFFVAGGLIYLYRSQIKSINKWILFTLVIISICIYYIFGGNSICCLLLSSTFLLYAIHHENRILDNRITSFISSVSMEIYLCHMFVFRVIEKLNLLSISRNGWIQYLVSLLFVLLGALVFSLIANKSLNYLLTNQNIFQLNKRG